MVMLFFGSKGAWAAQKIYVWTEDYATLAKGNAEIEFWNTAVTQRMYRRGMRAIGSRR